MIESRHNLAAMRDALHALSIFLWSVAASTTVAMDAPPLWTICCIGMTGMFGLYAVARRGGIPRPACYHDWGGPEREGVIRRCVKCGRQNAIDRLLAEAPATSEGEMIW